jgi:hypothetical protein
MARRRTSKKRRTSRKKQGVSVLGVAETVMLLNVASQAAFNTNAWQFLTSKGVAGSSTITLQELMTPENRFYDNPNIAGVQGASHYITTNLKKNWLGAAGMMILIPVGFKFGKNLARPAISRTNRLLNKAGVGSTVKL